MVPCSEFTLQRYMEIVPNWRLIRQGWQKFTNTISLRPWERNLKYLVGSKIKQ